MTSRVMRLKYKTGEEKGLFVCVGHTLEPVHLLVNEKGEDFCIVTRLKEARRTYALLGFSIGFSSAVFLSSIFDVCF